MDVGVRDLRSGLSRCPAPVRDGHTASVTDRGRVFACVVPVDRPTSPQEFVEAGVVTPARVPERPSGEPVVITATVNDPVSDQRR